MKLFGYCIKWLGVLIFIVTIVLMLWGPRDAAGNHFWWWYVLLIAGILLRMTGYRILKRRHYEKPTT